jgi:uncharacterized membrane protein YoaK (UPF0700 family)
MNETIGAIAGGNRRWRYLLTALAFAVHNGEEALAAERLLDFARTRAPSFLRDFYAGITPSELQASLLILTAVGLVVTAIAARSPGAPGSAFAMTVFAALLGLNAVAHIGLAFVARSYMPGLMTALLINLPLSATLILHARRETWVSPAALWAVFPVGVVLHGPVLAAFLRMNIAMLRMLT